MQPLPAADDPRRSGQQDCGLSPSRHCSGPPVPEAIPMALVSGGFICRILGDSRLMNTLFPQSGTDFYQRQNSQEFQMDEETAR